MALAVAALVAVCVSRRLRAYLVRQPGVAIVALGIVGMLLAQLVGGEWAPVEYFTPVIPALLSVTVVMLVRALRPDDGWTAHRALAAGATVAVAAVAITTLVHPGVGEYFTAPGDAGSVQQAGRIADVLRAHTHDGDLVLTMWAQASGLESGRDQVDGVTMGVFSYEDLTLQQARDYHFVNRAMLRAMLRRREPAAVVFTGVDELVFTGRGAFSARARRSGRDLRRARGPVPARRDHPDLRRERAHLGAHLRARRPVTSLRPSVGPRIQDRNRETPPVP